MRIQPVLPLDLGQLGHWRIPGQCGAQGKEGGKVKRRVQPSVDARMFYTTGKIRNDGWVRFEYLANCGEMRVERM